MFVKICGLTNRDDAIGAVEAGARAIGFVFSTASPRYVAPERVQEWIEELPACIWRVGVFVDEDSEAIGRIASQLKLDIAQLHGTETPECYPRGIRVWKAFRISQPAPIPDSPAEAILLDGPRSGAAFDWSFASDIRRPFVLAGGLNPENVREAIDRASPWGVDVSSGVESSPGRKDHARMKKFVEAALAA
jgi:phosphoribosylanthranilate isomerase